MGRAHVVHEIVLHEFQSSTLEAAKFLLLAGKTQLTCSHFQTLQIAGNTKVEIPVLKYSYKLTVDEWHHTAIA